MTATQTDLRTALTRAEPLGGAVPPPGRGTAGVVSADRTPPFYRGEQEPSSYCDRLMPDGNACDVAPAYEVWWTPVPSADLDTKPVSATCEPHAVEVDRALVETIRTHRDLSR